MTDDNPAEEVGVETTPAVEAPPEPPPRVFVWIIYYDPSNGEIVGQEYPHWMRDQNERRDNALFLPMAEFRGITNRTHRVDLATMTLVEMTDAEKRRADRPTMHEIRSAIHSQLLDTDKTQLPDFEVGGEKLTDEQRAAWVAYRSALRRLSDLNDPSAMVQAWPIRPDGADPIAPLRSRI